MTKTITFQPAHFSLFSTPSLPRVDRAELGKSLEPMSYYRLLLKGLKCAFSWGELILPPGAASGQLAASHSVIKLSSSTFAIPKLVNKGIELYDAAKEVKSCIPGKKEDSHQIRKVTKAAAGFFLSSIAFLNKSSKVLYSLHKTKVIDLKLISKEASKHVKNVCFVTSLPALFISVRKLVSLIQRYIVLGKASDLSRAEKEKKQGDLLSTIALKSFKVFSSVIGFVSFFLPALISPVFALCLSTISFALSLGRSVASAGWQNHHSYQSPIALKLGAV